MILRRGLIKPLQMDNDMTYNPDVHHRRSIRLPDYDYSQCGAYFVTICVYQMECFLGDMVNGVMRLSDVGQTVSDFWFKIPDHFDHVELDAFVVMPNHLHGIIVIGSRNTDMSDDTRSGLSSGLSRGLINQTPTTAEITEQANTKWILMKNPKQTLGKIIRHFKAKTSKVIHDMGDNDFHWQRNYYDHIIRNEVSFDKIKEYICENPLKWADDEYYPMKMSSNLSK